MRPTRAEAPAVGGDPRRTVRAAAAAAVCVIGAAASWVAAAAGGGPGADYFTFERAAVATGRLARTSAERELDFASLGGAAPPSDGPIAASLYSLPGESIAPGEAAAFLDDVRAVAAERELVVLTDGDLLAALRAQARRGVTLIDAAGRGYSPWPRDALTFTRTRGGAPVVLLRPNRQPGRERDAEMGLLLLAGAPAALDLALGTPRWSVAPVPFHNGQILWTPDATWVSGHTLERRALELLGVDRVPVESFGTTQGLDAYLDALSRAAGELEALYGQPVRFVHGVPFTGALAERQRGIWRIGGGAGFDLDSVLTLLPRDAGAVDRGEDPRRGVNEGATVALVGSVVAGSRLLSSVPLGELEPLARWLEFRGGAAWLRSLALRHQAGPRAAALEEFLDDVAARLAAEGLVVERLPLLLLPADLRPDGDNVDFLIGWHNAVLELGERPRAEAFATPIAAGDQIARQAYAAAGYRLELVSPLRHSVLQNGGYRCASNHLRRLP